MKHFFVRFVYVAATFVTLGIYAAEKDYLIPTDNLVIDGIPKIPLEMVDKLKAYTEFKSSTVLSWQPAQSGLLIRTRLKDTQQLHMLAAPGEVAVPLTDFKDAVSSAVFQPYKGEYLLFERASGGNEVFQIFRMDLPSKKITPLSDPEERAATPAWNRKGNRIVYTTTTIDRNNAGRQALSKVHIMDPLKPETDKVIATLDGGRWFGFRWSPDEKQLVFLEYISANESHLWTMDIGSGEKRRLTAARMPDAAPVFYGPPRYSRDGKSIYVVCDRDSEFRRLMLIDIASGKHRVLTEHLKFDVDDFAISNKARRIAFITNEEGSSVLRFLDLDTLKELPRPALIPGEISGLHWRNSGAEDEIGEEPHKVKDLAFNVASSRSPGDVYSLNIETGKITRWTQGSSRELNPMDFVEPKLVRWKSFDGLTISGFLYQPDTKKFAGKRPVLINIHGGPEAQARPGFINRSNYFINELGIAIIYPNVRGSSGFGKTFLALDNGKKREDSVKDMGALLDWIREQPDLDASRVMVSGGSYGGYMSLAVSVHYPERIVGAIDAVGISNWITFLNNTESYRRDQRRNEYGDERDAEMRAFLEKISPLNHAEKIKKPLFVIQGKNDPRVPYTEAEQIVAKLKKQGTPVWFLMANDEGHGFAKKSNGDFLFYAQIMFMKETLLK